MEQKDKASDFSDLKIRDKIKLLNSGEEFCIDKIFPDGCVDMTSVEPISKEFNWRQTFYSIRLVNFKILSE